MPNKVSDALIYLTIDGEIAETPDEAAFARQVVHFDDGTFISNTFIIVDEVKKAVEEDNE